MPRKYIVVGAIVIAIVGAPLGWYLVSPLFIDRVVDEDFPSPGPTEAMATAAAGSDELVDDPMPDDMSEMRVQAEGSFYPVAHEGEGEAVIYALEDGSRLLRFDSFEVLNGPDLHVWLVPVDPVPDTVGVEIEGYIDLGPLKGNVGSQNYDLPETFVLEPGWSVVVWCVPFRVPFAAAPLELVGQ